MRRHHAIKKVVLAKSRVAPESLEEARFMKEKVSLLTNGPEDGFAR